METYTVYIQSLNQDWQMPKELAQSLTDLLNERRQDNTEPIYIDVNTEWYNNLSSEQKMMVKKSQR